MSRDLRKNRCAFVRFSSAYNFFSPCSDWHLNTWSVLTLLSRLTDVSQRSFFDVISPCHHLLLCQNLFVDHQHVAKIYLWTTSTWSTSFLGGFCKSTTVPKLQYPFSRFQWRIWFQCPQRRDVCHYTPYHSRWTGITDVPVSDANLQVSDGSFTDSSPNTAVSFDVTTWSCDRYSPISFARLGSVGTSESTWES